MPLPPLSSAFRLASSQMTSITDDLHSRGHALFHSYLASPHYQVAPACSGRLYFLSIWSSVLQWGVCHSHLPHSLNRSESCIPVHGDSLIITTRGGTATDYRQCKYSSSPLSSSSSSDSDRKICCGKYINFDCGFSLATLLDNAHLLKRHQCSNVSYLGYCGLVT